MARALRHRDRTTSLEPICRFPPTPDSPSPTTTATYPVLSAAVTLLREAGRPNVYLEGQQNLLNYAELADSFRTLMEFFSDTEAVKRYVSPKSERTTVLLGDELPEYRMPGFCIMTKRYLAGGGLTGAIGIVGPTRMPYRETIPRLEYFALLLGECMSGRVQEE